MIDEHYHSTVDWGTSYDNHHNMVKDILRWQTSNHHGVVFWLQMRRLVEYPDLADMECDRLLFALEHFSAELGDVLERYNLMIYAPLCFNSSQVFLPAVLMRYSRIAQHFLRSGLPDCLGRSFLHVLSDADCKIGDWTREHINQADIFGRTAFVFCFAKRVTSSKSQNI